MTTRFYIDIGLAFGYAIMGVLALGWSFYLMFTGGLFETRTLAVFGLALAFNAANDGCLRSADREEQKCLAARSAE